MKNAFWIVNRVKSPLASRSEQDDVAKPLTIRRQFDSATADCHQRNLLATHEEEPTPPDDAGRRDNVPRQKHLDACESQPCRHAQGGPDIESILPPKGSSQKKRHGQRLPRHDLT